MQNHKLKFHSSYFFKFSNFCKISRAPAISLQAAANFPAAHNVMKRWQITGEEYPVENTHNVIRSQIVNSDITETLSI
jgi:hypothetical protein